MAGHIARWARDGKSMCATPFAEGGAFLKTDAQLERPNIQLHFVIAMVEDHARKIRLGYGFSCHMCKLRPESRGEVFLHNSDPLAAPGIDPKFLSDPRDLHDMVNGARMMRAILEAPALDQFRHRENLGTENAQSDADWEQHIRARADTIYHPVGTCKMGRNDMAVVAPDLKLHGAEGTQNCGCLCNATPDFWKYKRTNHYDCGKSSRIDQS
jgi:choline dehydrogenase-like flavoprotein